MARPGRISDAQAAELLERFMPAVRAYVARYTWVGADQLEDLLQVGRLAVIEAVQQRPVDLGAAGPAWVDKMVRWRIGDEVRRYVRAQRMSGHTDVETVQPPPSGRYDPELALLGELLIHGMGLLDPRERTIINARLRRETFQEAADRMSLSVASVHRTYQRAVRKLRAALDGSP